MASDKPITLSQASAVGGAEVTLGHSITEARKRRGVTPEEVTRETRIPLHYVRMMESDDYAGISDQLYMVPFLRRYASFLELDPEEIASRFVRDVQRSENTAPHMSEPIEMAEPRSGLSWGFMALGILLAAAIAALAAYGYTRVFGHRTASSSASVSGTPSR